MAKVAFNTLGCKVNQYETESMMAQFEARGYKTVAFAESADVYIVNTCTVTNMADKKSRQMLSRAKKNNPEGLVVAVGCYVQASEQALKQVENVDLLVGNTDKGRIVDVVEGYLEAHIIPEVSDLTKYNTYDAMWLTHESGHTRVHIKIQDGCDQFCSYCIIPYARGRIRSRDAGSIMSEVKGLVAKGYKEVVLTGIHLASYGVQFDDYKLIDLLEELDAVEGLERVRLGSLEPTLITEGFIRRLRDLNSVCDHFHLSLQSGDDTILNGMNRKYRTADYYNAIGSLREAFPDCGITTDLIVGFPGETDAHFSNTLAFLEKVHFSDVHVFKYSMRDGTKAAGMSKQVDGSVKNIRSQKAMSCVQKMSKEFRNRQLNQRVLVLIEELTSIGDVDYYVGHTSNYSKVYLRCNQRMTLNDLVSCTITELLEDGMVGTC